MLLQVTVSNHWLAVHKF